MPDATFAAPDVTTFCRLDELGLVVVGGDRFVTVVIDLTPVRDRTGPSRLLAMVEGRSQQAFQAWLAGRPRAWRDGLEVVAMDGFTGFKTATSHELPEATAVQARPRAQTAA